MRILGISGSLRAGSYNTILLRAAAEAVPQGVELVIWEGLREIPPYDADLDVEPAPEPVRRLREAIASADALLLATPEYNASVPGQLKNAVDWASRPFPESALRGVPAAVIGVSTGSFGGVWAQAELRKILATAGARVLEAAVAVPKATEAFDEQGRLLPQETRTALRGLVAELVDEASPVPAAA
jgi:chromate reductase